jgi:hypothetical protein
LFILPLEKFSGISKKPSVVLVVFCPLVIIVVIIIAILVYPSGRAVYVFAAGIFVVVYTLAECVIIPFCLFYSNKP